MNELSELIHEQLLDYGKQLKIVEKEIMRKYKSGEDFTNDLNKAAGLKMLQKECVLMMSEKHKLKTNKFESEN